MPMGSKTPRSKPTTGFIETCLYSGPQCSSLTFFFDELYSLLTVAWNLIKLIKRNPKGKNEKKKLEIRYGITWKLGKESEAHKIHFPFGNGVACRVGLKTLNSTVNAKV